MQNILLTKEEVLSLKEVAIDGNEKIVALHFVSGYRGRGGSNQSPPSEGIDAKRELSYFVGKEPYEIFGVFIRAVVNDTVYLSTKYGKVISFGVSGKYESEHEVAYDTSEYCVITPVLKEKLR